MDYIRPIIEESDYYVLIIKGKYGSVNADGLSFTQLEFEYAEKMRKPVLAFLYRDIRNITIAETDDDYSKGEKLKNFRELLLSRRIVSQWTNKDELVSLIKDAVSSIIRSKPAVGWVRGNQAVSVHYLKEMAELQRANAELKTELERLSLLSKGDAAVFEQGDDILTIPYHWEQIVRQGDQNVRERTGPFEYLTTWDRMFANLSELILREESEATIKYFIRKRIADYSRMKLPGQVDVEDSFFLQTRYQFQALGFIDVISRREDDPDVPGGTYGLICWRMTELGRRHISIAMARRRPIKSEATTVVS